MNILYCIGSFRFHSFIIDVNVNHQPTLDILLIFHINLCLCLICVIINNNNENVRCQCLRWGCVRNDLKFIMSLTFGIPYLWRQWFFLAFYWLFWSFICNSFIYDIMYFRALSLTLTNESARWRILIGNVKFRVVCLVLWSYKHCSASVYNILENYCKNGGVHPNCILKHSSSE